MDSWIDWLPRINACLNGLSATLILLGWRAIRLKKPEAHRKLMVAAFVTSALFLVSYLTRSYLTGTHRFVGPQWLRLVYLTILFSHMALAMVVVPLVLRTFYLAFRQRFVEHRRIVRFTLPIWLYVSVTGVVVYFMLYHLSATG